MKAGFVRHFGALQRAKAAIVKELCRPWCLCTRVDGALPWFLEVSMPYPAVFASISRFFPKWGALVLSALALGMGSLAQAQQPPVAPQDLGQLTQRWIDQTLRSGPPSALRMEVNVGALDERLRLAPCERVEPYLPVGSKLWGRTRLGLRCLAGPTRWNVFLPLTIKAYGPAWVLRGGIASGAVLSEADAIQAEVDWAAEPSPIVVEPSQWIGQTALFQLQAGQALRQSMLRSPYIFQAGAQVRVVAKGPGYAVVTAGQAMTAGAVRQTVRVRMPNGKLVSGVVAENGTVELPL